MNIKTSMWLGTGLLFGAIVVTLSVVLHTASSQERDGVTINLAGRQRMLSQKMTKEMLLYDLRPEADRLEALQGSVWAFGTTLKALLEGGEAPSTLDRKDPRNVMVAHPDDRIELQLQRVDQIWQPLQAMFARLEAEPRLRGELREKLLAEGGGLLREMNQAVALMTEVAESKVSALLRTAWMGGVVGALMVAWMVWLTRRMQGQIGSLQQGLEAMSNGDFRQTLPVGASPNELDDVASDINTVSMRMREVVCQVRLQSQTMAACMEELEQARGGLSGDAGESRRLASGVIGELTEVTGQVSGILTALERVVAKVDEVVAVSGGLSDSVAEVAVRVEAATGNVNAMATAAEEISGTTASVQASLEEVTTSVGQITDSVEGLEKAVSGIRGRCERAVEQSRLASGQAHQVSSTMEELTGMTREIGKVVEVINAIADQTNMLALNAAIEAAGAGDAGKGFAVVANEVKDLARKTAEATQMISSQIGEIVAKTREVSQAAEESAQRMEEVDEANQLIAERVVGQSRSIDRIRGAMERVEAAVGDVGRNMVELNQATREVAASLSRSAGDASKASGEVGFLVGRAVERAGEMVEHTRQMREISLESEAAVREVDESAQAAGERIRSMLEGLSFIDGAIRQTGLLIQTGVEPGQKLVDAVAHLRAGEEPFDLRHIKRAHLAWLRKLEDVIRGRSALTPEQVSSARECDLGRWYYGEGMSRFGGLGVFKEVEEAHLAVHEAAREVVGLMQGGRKAEAEAGMVRFNAIKDRLFVLLDRLYLESMEG
ncbi:MAG: type IV pili methyl-accepting chemotaxis transducer N-terminal domain-containing protein [Magnetococcales bacterium]|nr:type IV pili methyl-accepting chemotaxis transducer N-terminal domain-containing protein [Magnetococcales bacterium]